MIYKNRLEDELIGERVILRRTKSTIKMATEVFKVIDDNREHLKPWLPWEKLTLRVEDSLKYLFEKEELIKKGEKIEYGIFLNDEYVGNIGLFDIDKDNKSAEIGYWISSKVGQNGYVSEALCLIEQEGFESFDLNRIQIKCDEKNKGSAGVAKKCGYSLEGTYRQDIYSEHFKVFRNTLVFSKLKSEFIKN